MHYLDHKQAHDVACNIKHICWRTIPKAVVDAMWLKLTCGTPTLSLLIVSLMRTLSLILDSRVVAIA